MSNKTVFARSYSNRNISRDVAIISQDKLYEFVSEKVSYLHQVGKSIVGKTFGQDLKSFDFKSFPLKFKWILLDSVIIGEIREDYIEIIQFNKEKSPFIIPVSLLSNSDRDFASMLRKEINNSRVRAEAFNIRSKGFIADLELCILLDQAKLKFHKSQQF